MHPQPDSKLGSISITWHGKCISMHLEFFFFSFCALDFWLSLMRNEEPFDFCRMHLHGNMLNETLAVYGCIYLCAYVSGSVSELSRNRKWLQWQMPSLLSIKIGDSPGFEYHTEAIASWLAECQPVATPSHSLKWLIAKQPNTWKHIRVHINGECGFCLMQCLPLSWIGLERRKKHHLRFTFWAN